MCGVPTLIVKVQLLLVPFGKLCSLAAFDEKLRSTASCQVQIALPEVMGSELHCAGAAPMRSAMWTKHPYKELRGVHPWRHRTQRRIDRVAKFLSNFANLWPHGGTLVHLSWIFAMSYDSVNIVS